MIKYLRLFLFLTLFPTGTRADSQTVHIGYASDTEFIPLVSVADGMLKKVKKLPSASNKEIFEAFRPSRRSLKIEKWQRAVDDMSDLTSEPIGSI